MSRVTPAQTNFNGGEISPRLRARVDQAIYARAVKDMVGWAPLTEGAIEAMPGTIYVAAAPGPCRLFAFEFNVTQGQVVEASNNLFRVYTNDALIDGVAVASPYSWDKVQRLSTHVSYDVMYCFDGDGALAPRQFNRDSATAFSVSLLALQNGPFDDRNADHALTVTANNPTGTISLTATSGIFAAGDVGGLFRLEAKDFASVPVWEPGITVTSGAYRVSEDRVYQAATTGRTGGLQPTHTEGTEWDGMSTGTDINDKPAPGVQWTYVHDRYGIARITAVASATAATATVLRHLPFATGPFTTYRWAFGLYSDNRGYPQCGTIWNERLCLASNNRIDCSVVGDLTNFATLDEFGEVSADMAVAFTLDDPNAVRHLVADDKLIILNAAGAFTAGPASAAAGFGPKNYRIKRENNANSGIAPPTTSDGRTLYIDRSGRRVFELDFDAERGREASLDLTRYARHIGVPGLQRLAMQNTPLPFVWAVLGDGTLACASYNDDEQVLGWAQRPLAPGALARDLVAITDPDGIRDQLWLAVEFAGGWHVVRMAPWRDDGDYDLTAVMSDLAYVSASSAAVHTAPWLAHRDLEIVADGQFSFATADGTGTVVLDEAAARVVMGLAFPAYVEGLPIEAGGEGGPAISKRARISKGWVQLLAARGLRFGVPEQMRDLENPAVSLDWAPETGFHYEDDLGEHTETPRLRLERALPAQAGVTAWGCTVEVQAS